jgi:putative hemolysin
MAEKGIGFYSNGEFHLDMVEKKILKNAVELGRACISKDYRNTRVLFLLWRGIAHYLLQAGKRYMFGCVSLTSQDGGEGQWLYDDLKSKGGVDKNIKLPARPGFELPSFEKLPEKPIPWPPLLKMYFRYGAKIISLPAIDREFKTIDYLILLDLAVMGEENFKLFLGSDKYDKFPGSLG